MDNHYEEINGVEADPQMNNEEELTMQNEAQHIKDVNEIQRAFMQKMIGSKTHEVEAEMQWVNEHSVAFREALEELIKNSQKHNNGLLLHRWHDKSTQQELLSELEETMIKKETEKLATAA